MSNVFWNSLIITALISFFLKRAASTTRSNNQVHKYVVLDAGKNGTLTCEICKMSAFRWEFKDVNSLAYSTIYNGIRVTKNYTHMFTVSPSDASYVFIERADARYAGSYACVSDNGKHICTVDAIVVVAETSVQKEDVQLVRVINSGVQFSCNVTDDIGVRWHFTAINRDAEPVFVTNRVPAAFVRRFNVSVDRTRGVSDFYIEHVTSQDAGHYDCMDVQTGDKLFDTNLSVLQNEPTCSISKQSKNDTWNETGKNAVIITCTLCYVGHLKDHVTCTRQLGDSLTAMHHSNAAESNGSCKYHRHEIGDTDSPDFDQAFVCKIALISSTGSEHYSYSWSHEYTLTSSTVSIGSIMASPALGESTTAVGIIDVGKSTAFGTITGIGAILFVPLFICVIGFLIVRLAKNIIRDKRQQQEQQNADASRELSGIPDDGLYAEIENDAGSPLANCTLTANPAYQSAVTELFYENLDSATLEINPPPPEYAHLQSLPSSTSTRTPGEQTTTAGAQQIKLPAHILTPSEIIESSDTVTYYNLI